MASRHENSINAAAQASLELHQLLEYDAIIAGSSMRPDYAYEAEFWITYCSLESAKTVRSILKRALTRQIKQNQTTKAMAVRPAKGAQTGRFPWVAFEELANVAHLAPVSVGLCELFAAESKNGDSYAEITTFSACPRVCIVYNPRPLSVLSDVKQLYEATLYLSASLFLCYPQVSLASPVLLPSLNQIRAFGAYLVPAQRLRAACSSTVSLLKHQYEPKEIFLD